MFSLDTFEFNLEVIDERFPLKPYRKHPSFINLLTNISFIFLYLNYNVHLFCFRYIFFFSDNKNSLMLGISRINWFFGTDVPFYILIFCCVILKSDLEKPKVPTFIQVRKLFYFDKFFVIRNHRTFLLTWIFCIIISNKAF